MKSKSLDVLQKMCLQFLKDNNYSESTIEKAGEEITLDRYVKLLRAERMRFRGLLAKVFKE